MMKMEYLAIGVLTLVVAAIITYLVGERAWGKQQLNRGSAFAFGLYRKVNRVKLIKDRDYKETILLSLIKVGPEITSVTPNFNVAQHTLSSKTVFKLVDIYDDYRGHRYFKVNTPKYGVLIFEVSEYMKVSLDKRIKDRILGLAPKGISKEKTTDLETRPMLKVIKPGRKEG